MNKKKIDDYFNNEDVNNLEFYKRIKDYSKYNNILDFLENAELKSILEHYESTTLLELFQKFNNIFSHEMLMSFRCLKKHYNSVLYNNFKINNYPVFEIKSFIIYQNEIGNKFEKNVIDVAEYVLNHKLESVEIDENSCIHKLLCINYTDTNLDFSEIYVNVDCRIVVDKNGVEITDQKFNGMLLKDFILNSIESY